MKTNLKEVTIKNDGKNRDVTLECKNFNARQIMQFCKFCKYLHDRTNPDIEIELIIHDKKVEPKKDINGFSMSLIEFLSSPFFAVEELDIE